ncbi:SDR family NAD(P)-dependent oxidoreductase [Streptomyces sp. NPDC003247]|uniref:SDR family NAD(P)-dependent oxidoreductase n=1 Tax=Streptomyces sp. NPDC003247 TaxID=3364677 RepID=UPI0036C12088
MVVTGGTRGIGYGLVRAFLDRGCRVALCGRVPDTVEAAVAALGAPPGRVLGLPADVTDRDRLAALWDAAHDAFGTVDVWINNAGAATARRPLWELSAAETRAVTEANLLGVAHGSAVATAGFLALGRGSVWNMEGFGSDGRLLPGLGAYGATKRAVAYLTQALATDLRHRAGRRPHDVRAMALSPGMVVTDVLTHGYTPEEYARVRKVLDILADRVETVTPWLADQVLSGRTRNGGRVAWLTRRKAAARFATAAFRHRHVMPDLPAADRPRAGTDDPARPRHAEEADR